MPSNSSDVFRFFAKSADKEPGKGAQERVSDPAAYEVLKNIPDWRKVLSNFHVCPFAFEGRVYRTIEHAFQAEKIRLESPLSAELFSVNSGSPLAAGDGLAARRERKMVVLSKPSIARWNRISMDVMDRLAQAKFAQCPSAMAVLLATGSAQLVHAAPRMAPVRFTHLERIRDHARRRLLA